MPHRCAAVGSTRAQTVVLSFMLFMTPVVVVVVFVSSLYNGVGSSCERSIIPRKCDQNNNHAKVKPHAHIETERTIYLIGCEA